MRNVLVILLCNVIICFSCKSQDRAVNEQKKVESVYKKFIDSKDSVELFTYYLLIDSLEKAKVIFPYLLEFDFSEITFKYDDGAKFLPRLPAAFTKYFTSSEKTTMFAVLFRVKYHLINKGYDQILQQAISKDSRNYLAIYLLASLRAHEGYFSDTDYLMSKLPKELLEEKELSLIAELREKYKSDKNYGMELTPEVNYPDDTFYKTTERLPDSIGNKPFTID